MMRPALFLLLLTAGLSACLGGTPAAGGLEYRPLPLSAADPASTRLGETEVLGILELRADDKEFGGLSGLTLNGDEVTAVTDAGHWVRFRLDHDAAWRPLGVSGLAVAPLGGLDGGKRDGDAEEVVATPDGPLVSFERRHRLWLYPDGLSGRPRPLAPPSGFDRQPDNGGAEAVAVLADGRLLAISEEGGEGGIFSAWIGRDGAWQGLGYRRSEDFHPTAAAMLPGGDLLVLERRFSLAAGVGMRLVQVAGADIRAGHVLAGRELARADSSLTVDNFEGLAVARRADGRLVALLLSDDNFNPLQATLLMVLLLPDRWSGP
ncbi:esterase-like activity of phytase family protein [Magnetospirillum sp. UT-4]|uniref:esterase-like activity of phytase family protein n=1 Tax=Magnetospirillum sp. UT-4 TaxID=2681467 RepID=UPI001380348D|nr:esterase-like activity of phytase family protein [Magnetospirillum sp. UT-4]CAA7615999.1 conserved exported hypothetical protein [Magnetospirillum sp. UT-4]